MKDLGSLVRSFSKEQKKELKKYLKLNYFSRKDTKLYKFFDLILNKDKDEEFVIRNIFEGKRTKVYSQIRTRVKNILEEFILVYTFRSIRNRRDKRIKDVILELRLNSVLADALDKIIVNEDYSLYIWEQNLKLAKENFNSRFVLESLIKLFNNFKEPNVKEKEFEETFNALWEAKKIYDAEFAVFSYYVYLSKISFFKLFKEKRQLKKIEKAILDIEKKYKDVKSDYFVNNLYTIKLLYYGNIAPNPESYDKIINEAYTKLVDKNTKINRFNITLASAIINILLNDKWEFKKTEKLLMKIINSLKENDFNKGLTYFMLGICYYYTGDLEKIKEILDLCNNFTEKYETLKERFLLLSAVYNFVRREYNETLTNINSIRNLLKDREGYSSDVRFIELITIIELDEYDFFINRLEALRKFIKNNQITRKYDNIFFNFLRELDRKSMDFSQIDLESYLEEMKECWNNKPTVYILPYHMWIESKLTGKPFYNIFLEYYNNKIKVNP